MFIGGYEITNIIPLLSLIALEVILGIDNIIFISFDYKSVFLIIIIIVYGSFKHAL